MQLRPITTSAVPSESQVSHTLVLLVVDEQHDDATYDADSEDETDNCMTLHSSTTDNNVIFTKDIQPKRAGV